MKAVASGQTIQNNTSSKQSTRLWDKSHETTIEQSNPNRHKWPSIMWDPPWEVLGSHPWWVLHGAGLCSLSIRIGLSHHCITGLASWSCGLCLLVLCCHVMSCRLPWPSLMHGVVLVHYLLLLTDWLDVHVLCHCTALRVRVSIAS